jgi:hypothetical protein
MDEFEEDLKDAFKRDATEVSPPAIDAGELAARDPRWRRIRYGIRIALTLALAVGIGAIFSPGGRDDGPTVSIIQSPDSKRSLLGMGSPSASPSMSPSPPATFPKTTTKEAVPPAEPEYDPPSIGGRYEIINASEELVPEDHNGEIDVFRHDLDTDEYIRVSVSSSGEEPDGESMAQEQSMSADGRYVVFWSNAQNLTADDGDPWSSDRMDGIDLFLRDILNETTTLIRHEDARGRMVPGDYALSADGKHLAVAADFTESLESQTVYLLNLTTDSVVRTTDDSVIGSGDPDISADGRHVTFTGWRAEDRCGTDEMWWGCSQVYIFDAVTGRTELISISPKGTRGNGTSHEATLSDDGRLVRFRSCATNLLFEDADPPTWPQCSEDSTNSPYAVFERDVSTGVTKQVA